ncbi:hypothetical protein AX14_001537 [Amanita brunnescens Koide BX004]|nr:hypothetical protein AX14_001537 [Amanita brunnescens Koide BX004]
MATSQHYLWASGHFILLIAATRYFLAAVFLKAAPWWYKTSFLGALISYAIVCYKSLGPPQPSGAWLRRAILDENVQYFILAMFWYSSKPVALALVPYTIFSLFHALTFSRTSLLPQILPPGPPPAAGGTPQPHPFAKKLQIWVKNNYDGAMRVVAYTEVVIFLRVVLGALLFQNSFLSPLIYAHFLRQRYYHSAFTREAIGVAVTRVEKYINQPGTPPVAKQIWEKGKAVISSWGGSATVQSQAAPAAGAGRR